MTISTKPKERPILFSAPMVRAILDGRKTVTRRAVNPQPVLTEGSGFSWKDHLFGCGSDDRETARNFSKHCCPFGKPGDRLYVRETCFINDYREAGVPVNERASCEIHYRADGIPEFEGEEELIRWRPSIHMPRWACRILLEITDVRVERLQDISEEQAQAEGCFFTDYGKACFHGGKGVRDAAHCELPESTHQQRNGWMWDKTTNHEQCLDSARNAFGNLWQTTGGDWAANPWVWVVQFKRVQP
ncbi:hypothetical protein [Pseudomonas sp. SCPG-7]|uniref:hypothetical protein n=1 Tax=Pseudomonas sp. SCPG-7 TaxID=1961714 RepID=UPI000A39A4C0|nr:hypothetical protein [Pseudomonas sp. SCPG-7]